MINDDESIENILDLAEMIKMFIDENEDTDVVVSRIMYKVILFILSNSSNEKILHRYCWNYFVKNKDYFIDKIP